MQPEPRRLPEANEFSPGQVELGRTLEIAAIHEGNRAAIVETLRSEYFSDSAASRVTEHERLQQQLTRANNVLIGMKGYGLFDLKINALTQPGRSLLATNDAQERSLAFAKHILRTCNGFEVLDAVRALQRRDERVTKASLQAELERFGFKLPRATTHHTKLLQWLREAGVIDKSYEIDEEMVAELTGLSLGHLRDWQSLTGEQRAFARTLKRLALIRHVSLSARDVLTQAKLEHGAIFREDQLASRVYAPLAAQGWIVHEAQKKGRGGKSGEVLATEKLLTLDLNLIPPDDDWGIPPELRPKLDTPLAQIALDLESSDKNIKGVALELLALRIATDSGLTPLRFRLRAAETGQAEVDLIAEGVHLHFSRWLFQCKNTATVALHDLAKEVGMAVLLRAHVIVMVTTGRFAATVSAYARELMDVHHVQVILIDGRVLTKYRAGGLRALMDHLRNEAESTMRLKRSQIEREVLDHD